MMTENVFETIVKHWLEVEGYDIKHQVQIVINLDDSVAHKIFEKAYNQLYAENRQYAIIPDFPSSIFVKKVDGCYPDIIALKNGKAYAFEVKTNLENEKLDRCIGQCLRYLTFSWMDSINVVVPKGIEGVVKFHEIVSKFKLLIQIIELTEDNS